MECLVWHIDFRRISGRRERVEEWVVIGTLLVLVTLALRAFTRHSFKSVLSPKPCAKALRQMRLLSVAPAWRVEEIRGEGGVTALSQDSGSGCHDCAVTQTR